MARISSFLWLLGLILGSGGNWVEIKMINTSPPVFNTKVELKCETTYLDAGMFWILQKRDHTIHFILYVSSRSKLTPPDITGYTAANAGNYYQLTITSFEEKDQGIYYCILHRNQVLYFSSGLQILLPEPPTPPPAIPHQVSTRSKGLVTEKGVKCPSPTASETDPSSMKFPCEYLWVPLAGGCFLLLISLVITISVCCCGLRRRRKICNCKRPMNGTNGKLPLPR